MKPATTKNLYNIYKPNGLWVCDVYTKTCAARLIRVLNNLKEKRVWKL